MSSHVSPAFASALAHASGLPCSIRYGSTPESPKETNRARGSRPSRSTASSLASSIAAEPSTIELEFPAVTTPSALKAGWSDASFSSEVSRRGVSSTAKSTTAPPAPDLDRDDLALEPALVDRGDRAPVRLERVLVQRLAREVPLLGEHLGRDALRHDRPALADLLVDRAPAEVAEVRPHRHARHVLDARRDDDVEVAGLDRRRAVERGLQRRSALAVDRRGADRLRPAGDEHRLPADVQRLLADLGHAAHLHVLDLAGLDVEPVDEAVQDLRRELVGADLGERAAAPPDRGANRIDDERVTHREA